MRDRESAFIKTLLQSRATFGIGDDGVEIGEYVIASDAFFEDVHFKRQWTNLQTIVEKCFLVNLSDIYAMNAIPSFALLCISIPKNFLNVSALANSLGSCANKYGIKLIGGDTLIGDKLHLSLTLLGKKQKKLLTRKGIKKGDIVGFITPRSVLTHCKTQALGGNVKALKLALRFHRYSAIPRYTRFVKPILYPKMLYALNLLARAGMDISDGIFIELQRLSQINQMGFHIFKPKGTWFYAPEEYQMLYVVSKRHVKHFQNIAHRFRHSFIPFATAIRGRFKTYSKNWHY